MTASTTSPAPATAASITYLADVQQRAEIALQAARDRIALVALLQLGRSVQAHHPNAATITLEWNADGLDHLDLFEVTDHDGRKYTYDEVHDDPRCTARDLDVFNQNIWRSYVTDNPDTGTFALAIDTALAVPATTTPDPAVLDTLGAGKFALVPGSINSVTSVTTPVEVADAAEANVCAGPSGHRIEIVSYRDPEDGTDLRAFLDGTEVDGIDWYEADPGRGHTLADWRSTADSYAETATPKAAAAIHAAFDCGEHSSHVTG